MPIQHYLFAHRFLPHMLWQGDSMLGILANPDNQEYLHDIWNRIPHTPMFESLRERRAVRTPLDEMFAQAGLSRPGPEVAARIAPPDGLSYESFWIGGQHLVVLITMPPPEEGTGACFVAITHSPDVRYFTLELMEGGGTTLCEWQESRHLNFGGDAAATVSRPGSRGANWKLRRPSQTNARPRMAAKAAYGTIRRMRSL